MGSWRSATMGWSWPGAFSGGACSGTRCPGAGSAGSAVSWPPGQANRADSCRRRGRELDVPRPDGPHECGVGGGELQLRSPRSAHPGQSLMLEQTRLPPGLHLKEDDPERLPRVLAGVERSGRDPPRLQRQLLQQFAAHRLTEGLPGIDLASGEFPETPMTLVRRSLPHQEPPGGVPEDGSNDVDGVGHGVSNDSPGRPALAPPVGGGGPAAAGNGLSGSVPRGCA